MPQLMPLFWCYSSFMLIFLVLMMMNMFYYKEVNKFMIFLKFEECKLNNCYQW